MRDVNRAPDQAVMAYWVSPRFRGRGIAPRALDAVARWAFTPISGGGLGLHRLNLYHAVVNTGSCRVAVKAGFRLEGTMREEFVEPSGQRYDSHLHARLATDPRPQISPPVDPDTLPLARQAGAGAADGETRTS